MRRRLLVIGAVVIALLAGAVLYGAYGYRPGGGAYTPPGRWLAGSRYLETPTARFHYVRAGTGSPVVLLSPGSAWTFAWQDQITALSATHTVYAVDLPGQGFTTLHDRSFPWTLAGMTGAVGEFLDAAGLGRVTLVGNSWSGGWALAYAQRHPGRVGALALLDPSGLAERDVWSWEALKYPVVGPLLNNLSYASPSVLADNADQVVVHTGLLTDDVARAYWAPGTFPDNLHATLALERGLDWRETQRAMPATRQPVLLIWGRQDRILPVRQAARFHELLPRDTLRVLDGCGHAVMLDCPDRVDPLLVGFADDH